VLIRYFRHPGLDDCLRITVGSPEEVQVLVSEIKSIIKEETTKGGRAAI
jgi:histidinol-phosphate/aromatic aminotransferase/cobyric acid decarboxylase-like protein